MVTRSLIPLMTDLIIINANPGLSRSNLGREFDLSLSLKIVPTLVWYLSTAHSAEKGARNLSHAVAHGSDSVDVSCYFFVRGGLRLKG